MPRGGRKKGADSYKIDRRIVPWLPDWCRVAKRTLGLSDFEAIRMLVEINPRHLGVTVPTPRCTGFTKR